MSDCEHELAEAQSEIARHHELIAWMHGEMVWLLDQIWTFSPDRGKVAKRTVGIRQRLNREVS